MEDWIYNDKKISTIGDFPEDTYGFVYKITNLTKGKVYYGKKKLVSTRNKYIAKSTYDKLRKKGDKTISRRKSKKKSTKKNIVWNYRKEERKETNWKKYVGSNKQLKKDFKKGDRILREILYLCKNETDMNFYETRAIICSDCFEMNKDCYNEWHKVILRKDALSKNK